MSLPAYMWIEDENGQAVEGGSQVADRQGSCEVLRLDHHVNLPSDPDTGRINATRKHAPFAVLKSIDQASPWLFKACCDGKKLNQVTLKLYRINKNGQEEAYYQYLLKNARVVSYSPANNAGESHGGMDYIAFSYESIEHSYLDGNHTVQDTWLIRS